MCLLKSKFTGCDFNETVFKDAVFRRCLPQYANLNGSVLRQVILDETRLTVPELSECKVQGLQLRAADLTGTNCFKTYFSGYGFDRYGNQGNNPVQGLCRTARCFDNAVSGGRAG